jgi:hypothetical protein
MPIYIQQQLQAGPVPAVEQARGSTPAQFVLPVLGQMARMPASPDIRPPAPQVVVRYVTLPEPYQGWRQELVKAFRELDTRGADFNPRDGWVGRVVMSGRQADCYLVSARYRLSFRDRVHPGWLRAVTDTVFNANIRLERDSATGALVPAWKLFKPVGELRVGVSLVPLSRAGEAAMPFLQK